MPFGMVNSGATLVLGLKRVLEGFSGVGGYIDDVVVYNEVGRSISDIESIVWQADKSYDHSLTYEMEVI